MANVYLHRLDEQMVQAGYGLVRYADDFVLFARSQSEAVAALELAREVLEGELGLVLHPEKTRVVTVAEAQLKALEALAEALERLDGTAVLLVNQEHRRLEAEMDGLLLEFQGLARRRVTPRPTLASPAAAE